MAEMAIAALAVVIPARDEVESVGAAVTAAIRAMDAAESMQRVRTVLVVVADACVDDTAAEVRRAAGRDERVHVLVVDERSVGRSRASGVACVLDLFSDLDADRIWIANTDADSQVPVDWCIEQLSCADTGADAVTGTVVPVGAGASPAALVEWRRTYRAVEGHGHVHGTNLGVRASAYIAAGGFPPFRTDEDVGLVGALRRHGHRVMATALVPVRTSARTVGRAPHGFADFLAAAEPLC